jgi:hypothetical protein
MKEEFSSDDFALLERFSQSTYGDKLFKFLRNEINNNDAYGMLK